MAPEAVPQRIEETLPALPLQAASSATTSYSPAPPNDRLVAARYRIEAEIGSGGMGRVFRVRHARLGKTFALKVMRARLSGEEQARDRFYREARVASSLAHPRLVSVVDFGEDEELGAFMVMELLEGESLATRLQAEGRLPLKIVCDELAQLANALAYMHRKGIVHADIKPSNIYLCRPRSEERRGWALKLLDFGLARNLASAATTGEVGVAGTPEYVAPERIRGFPPLPSTDIYGLGVLAYELLAGRPPFCGQVASVIDGHLHRPPVPLATTVAIETCADEFVLRALAKDPDARPRDMATFQQELRALMNQLGMGRRRGTSTGVHVMPVASERRNGLATAAFDRALVPMAALGADGRIQLANRAFVQFLTGGVAPNVEGTNDRRLAARRPATRSDGRPPSRLRGGRRHAAAPGVRRPRPGPGVDDAWRGGRPPRGAAHHVSR